MALKKHVCAISVRFCVLIGGQAINNYHIDNIYTIHDRCVVATDAIMRICRNDLADRPEILWAQTVFIMGRPISGRRWPSLLFWQITRTMTAIQYKGNCVRGYRMLPWSDRPTRDCVSSNSAAKSLVAPMYFSLILRCVNSVLSISH